MDYGVEIQDGVIVLFAVGEPAVPASQPPPDDMPPVWLMVLESLVDDGETIVTMRLQRDHEPHGIALVGESHILEALRFAIARGYVEVREWRQVDAEHRPEAVIPSPQTDDDSLRRYWYYLAPAGRAAFEEADEMLDRYWAAHPG